MGSGTLMKLQMCKAAATMKVNNDIQSNVVNDINIDSNSNTTSSMVGMNYNLCTNILKSGKTEDLKKICEISASTPPRLSRN